MSKERSDPDLRSVHLGPREWAESIKLAEDFNIPGAQRGVRMGVTIASALNNARRVGLSMQLIGPNGRWYSYELSTPKLAHELDRQGMRTGKTIDLVDIVPTELPPPSWLAQAK